MSRGIGQWGLLIFGGVGNLVTEWLMKTKPEKEEASTPMTAPSVQDGINIPVLFGSRMIKSPMIAWWGDVGITKVEVPGGGKKG